MANGIIIPLPKGNFTTSRDTSMTFACHASAEKWLLAQKEYPVKYKVVLVYNESEDGNGNHPHFLSPFSGIRVHGVHSSDRSDVAILDDLPEIEGTRYSIETWSNE